MANLIRITKQNTLTIPVKLYGNGSNIKLGENDYLVFTVRENIDDEGYFIRKKITSADYNEQTKSYFINILPSDTENVELNNYDDKKYYYYDITFYSGTSQRTLNKGKFIVEWRASKGSES